MRITKYKNKKFYIEGDPMKRRLLKRNPAYTYRCGYVNLSELARILPEVESFQIVEKETGREITEDVLRALARQNLERSLNKVDSSRLKFFAFCSDLDL